MKVNNKDISLVYYGTLAIQFIAHGTNILWQIISSCFGSGRWINSLKWSNTDKWKNS